MAAAPAVSRKLTFGLALLVVAVGATAVTWKAWDMFGPRHRPMLQGWNDSFYYFWLPAVVIHHDLDFSKELATSGTITAASREHGLTMERTATGLFPNKYPPGWALGSLPFFLVAHIFSPSGATGFEPIYLTSVWVGQIVYGAVGLWLAMLIIRRLVPGAPAAATVLGVWLASPLVYYQSARVSLSHNQVFVLAMAVFWLALRVVDGDDRRRTWLTLGFASALLVATRNITIVYLAFPAVLLVRRFSWRGLRWACAGAIFPALIQVVAWKLLYGSWIAYSYGDEGFDFSDLHVGGVLFSPRHGFFYWHPLLLVGMVALIYWCRRHPLGWAWIGSFVVITILNAAWPCWWFASSFGNRGFEVPIFFGMFGVAALLEWTRENVRWQRVVVTAVSAAIVWNLLLFALFLTRRIPQETSVTYAEDIRALVAWVRGSDAPQISAK